MGRRRHQAKDTRTPGPSGGPAPAAARAPAREPASFATAGRGRLPLVASAVAALLLATAVTFAPVLANAYVNWDDPDVLVRNAALDAPGLLGWAFTTTHVGHYQPLAWLVWAATRRLLGDGPAAAHGVSLGLHLLAAALVFFVARALAGALPARALVAAAPATAEAPPAGGRPSAGAVAILALAAALVFALHPLRVEPVAWASALPYPLALAPLLLATLAYLRYAMAAAGSRAWLGASVVLYAASLLARPLAPGFFLVLLLLDAGLGRLDAARRPHWQRVAAEKLPFALLGLAGAAVESAARRFAGLEQVPPAERLAAAVAAPFLYLGRTLWPLALTPLDALPLAATAPWPRLGLAALALALLTAAAARTWRRHRPAWLLLLAYAVLLAPASGLAPSGLQASADRYTYAPAVPLSLLLAGALLTFARTAARASGTSVVRVALPLLGAVALALGALSWRQARVWRDSTTLWSHALAVDSRNDVVLYNLATALAEGGDRAGAAVRYRELLALVPDHGPGRRNLALLEAGEHERQGNAHAAAGRFAEAERAYAEALARDPARLHARASRGMALARLGRCPEAIPELRAALDAARDEPPLWGALGYCLAATGDAAAARATLEQALKRHPGDPRLRATRDSFRD